MKAEHSLHFYEALVAVLSGHLHEQDDAGIREKGGWERGDCTVMRHSKLPNQYIVRYLAQCGADALGRIHVLLQQKNRLPRTAYEICHCGLVHERAMGSIEEVIEKVDLPRGENPDAAKKPRPKPVETMEMFSDAELARCGNKPLAGPQQPIP